jgi:hypothetical protein
MTFKLLGLSEEDRLAIEQTSGGLIRTEAAQVIVDLAARNTADQVRELVDNSLKEIQSIIGPHGSVTRLQAGGIHITPGEGIGIYEDGVLKTTLKTSGDLVVGSDITQPETTTMYCFVNDQTYNNEDMGAGDLLIGDNSTANMFYDASEGQLQFRNGQTINVYIDTDGTLKAGAGRVTLDTNGVTLTQGSAATDTQSRMKWESAGTVYSYLIGYLDTANRVQLETAPVGSLDSYLTLKSDGPNTKQGRVDIQAYHNGTNHAALNVVDNNGVGSVQLVIWDSTPTLFKVALDGNDKRFEIGLDHIFATRDSPNTSTYINEANQDMDTYIRTASSDNAFVMDAGLDKATSFLWDGWANMAHHTWTRTGNHTFTVSGDVTATYSKDTKVRYKDGGAYEYGVIGSSSYSSPNTTVTLITNTDYAMAAATITDNYLSNAKKPEGFPEWFNWAAAPTNFTGTYVSKWKALNDMLKFEIELSSTSTVAGSVTITLPIAHTRGTATPVLGVGYFLDAGNASYPGQLIAISTTTARPVAFPYNPTSATNPLYVTQSYMAAAVPFTWGNTDAAQFAGEYPY